MIGHRTVDLHNNGDCWPSQCPVCEIEDAREAAVAFEQCPHEVIRAACGRPCGCGCTACQRLDAKAEEAGGE